MNQKRKVLLLSYGAAAVFTTTGLLFTTVGGAEGYRLSQDNEYRRAMGQLVSSVSQVDAALEKGTYTTGAGMSGKVCAQLMSAAQSASTALSILPLDTYALEEVAGFLSQMEEYARVKGAMACGGSGFSDGDRETFAQLQEVTGQLVPVLGEMFYHLSEGGMEIRGRNQERGLVTDEADSYLEDEILRLLEDFPETPELVYAGKLSADWDDSHQAVAGLRQVTEQEAYSVAAKLSEDENLHSMGLSQGKLPAYYFSGETEGGNLTVAVTQQGGLPALYLTDDTPGEAAVSEAEAKRSAQAFLEAAGYDRLREEKAVQEGGFLELEYVYADGDAAFMSDRIKVTVALDTGKVAAMDASEYLQSHKRNHAVEKPKLTAEEAAEIAVPEGYTVTKQELTWYTGDTGTTTLCWRLTCQRDGEPPCVIYAHSGTGQQMEIVPQSGENMSEL